LIEKKLNSIITHISLRDSKKMIDIMKEENIARIKRFLIAAEEER